MSGDFACTLEMPNLNRNGRKVGFFGFVFSQMEMIQNQGNMKSIQEHTMA